MVKITSYEEMGAGGTPNTIDILDKAIEIVKHDSCATQTPAVKLKEVVKALVDLIESDLGVKKG